MLLLTRKKYGITIREIYFSNQVLKKGNADIDFYIQCKATTKNKKLFHTILIDLAQSEDLIFANFSKNCKYEIRRAKEKDNLITQTTFAPDQELLNRFIEFYNAFAAFKKVPPANIDKIKLLIEQRNLCITYISPNGEIQSALAMHCYICDTSRIRLYLSATYPRTFNAADDKQIIGRANKLLHWEDIVSAKNKGILLYDLGGISTNGNLKGIDSFKQQFGGEKTLEYNQIIGKTFKGKVLITIYNVIQYLRPKP